MVVDGVGVVKLEFRHLKLLTQVRMVSASRGLISIEGAAFTQQFFLPPMSAVYIMSTPVRIDPFRRECWDWPETWHEMTGLHLGHTVFHWRFCGDGDEFSSFRPNLTLQFLLQKNEEARYNRTAWLCILLSPPANITSGAVWPYCSFNVALPVERPFAQCGAFGNVGLPFLFDGSKAEIVDAKVYPFTSKLQPDFCCAEPKSAKAGACQCHVLCRRKHDVGRELCLNTDGQGVRPMCKPSDCQEPVDDLKLTQFDFG
eukprot:gnl/TRDRNA2_/TRDRNA2_206284_c0_seq1.p1 gnl/TRDRNA2_/TRDRNA2_206284_c0~~gnl/TRDRNA2_/TRDRNA2_206284_c0_seq1.p1  ORF type:complete len:292 (-),score=20.55 gnl/TRDRNA2_/TRDRNA2_206284_c0_seq1:250-1020(-)